MTDTLNGLYEVIQERRTHPQEGSYTCYLFEKGTDKILKKCGEECSEVIIAAKNGQNEQTAEEICDLLYHLLVLMVEQNLSLEQVEQILEVRRQKIGNLKQFYQSDHNSWPSHMCDIWLNHSVSGGLFCYKKPSFSVDKK